MLKHLRDHAEHHTGAYIWSIWLIGLAGVIAAAVGGLRIG